jgi:hypothetical protein
MHLLHHVVEGIEKFGPLRLRWAFPYERALCWVSRQSLNKKHPEVTILQTYAVSILINGLLLIFTCSFEFEIAPEVPWTSIKYYNDCFLESRNHITGWARKHYAYTGRNIDYTLGVFSTLRRVQVYYTSAKSRLYGKPLHDH